MEIEEIISRLIGRIDVCGSHQLDMESLENLHNAEIIINMLISKLYNNSLSINRNEASMQQVAERSFEILKEIKSGIDVHIEEIEEMMN